MSNKLDRERQIIRRTIAALLAVGFTLGVLDWPPFRPTDWQARAALAEAGYCAPDAAIVWREDRVVEIGHVRWKLRDRVFYWGGYETSDTRGRFFYSWAISAPFGHWVATKPRIHAVF